MFCFLLFYQNILFIFACNHLKEGSKFDEAAAHAKVHGGHLLEVYGRRYSLIKHKYQYSL